MKVNVKPTKIIFDFYRDEFQVIYDVSVKYSDTPTNFGIKISRVYTIETLNDESEDIISSVEEKRNEIEKIAKEKFPDLTLELSDVCHWLKKEWESDC